MNTEVKTLYKRLLEVIKPYGRVIVAYSGGVDSALVLKAALDCHGSAGVLGITASSPSVPGTEVAGARELAEEIGAPHHVIYTEELKSDHYRANGLDRCFHCKTELYDQLEKIRLEKNYDTILNGANIEDQNDHRPGHLAASRLGIRSPLVDASFGKSQIRHTAQYLDLKIWNKPQSPCLASRIPYHQEVTVEKLKQIEKAEDFLSKLGFRDFRVRHHGEIARIEISDIDVHRFFEASVRKKIAKALKKIGFCYIALDLDQFRSGNLNNAKSAK